MPPIVIPNAFTNGDDKKEIKIIIGKKAVNVGVNPPAQSVDKKKDTIPTKDPIRGS